MGYFITTLDTKFLFRNKIDTHFSVGSIVICHEQKAKNIKRKLEMPWPAKEFPLHFTSFQPLRSPALRYGLLRSPSFGSFRGNTFALSRGVRQPEYPHSHAHTDITVHWPYFQSKRPQDSAQKSAHRLVFRAERCRPSPVLTLQAPFLTSDSRPMSGHHHIPQAIFHAITDIAISYCEPTAFLSLWRQKWFRLN